MNDNSIVIINLILIGIMFVCWTYSGIYMYKLNEITKKVNISSAKLNELTTKKIVNLEKNLKNKK